MVTTWGETLCALAILAGIAACTLGSLSAIAANFAPEHVPNAGNGGCIAVIVGLALIAGGVAGLLI